MLCRSVMLSPLEYSLIKKLPGTLKAKEDYHIESVTFVQYLKIRPMPRIVLKIMPRIVLKIRRVSGTKC